MNMNLMIHENNNHNTANNIYYNLRGIICFKISHYCCYFYYTKTKTWYLFDDTYTEKFSTLNQVSKNILENDGIPVILFYEETLEDFAALEKEENFVVLEKEEDFLRSFNCFDCKIT